MSDRRVVHVVRSDAFAGVERYIVDVSSELARRGWEVTVIGGDPDQMRAELVSGIAYRPANTVAAVARELRSVERIDVLHAHMTAAELPAALASRRLGARLVVTRHFASPYAATLAGRLARQLVRRRTHMQIAISQFVADAVREPCVVIHNGVAPSTGAAPARRDVVVMLQRLEWEKDTATAIRAWVSSGLGNRGWRLEICGRGSQAAALQTLAHELGGGASIDFAGFVDDPRQRLASASIMLATASAEPFGLSVVEAMAEATPVVASESGAHPETVGEHGLLFPPGDAEAAAVQLCRLAQDRDDRAARGAALQQRQRDEFSVVAHVDRLERAYTS